MNRGQGLTGPSFEAAILGLSSYSHVTTEAKRIQTLSSFARYVRGPILISFYPPISTETFCKDAQNPQLRMILKKRFRRQPDDRFSVNIGFVHGVSATELEAAANQSGLKFIQLNEGRIQIGHMRSFRPSASPNPRSRRRDIMYLAVSVVTLASSRPSHEPLQDRRRGRSAPSGVRSIRGAQTLCTIAVAGAVGVDPPAGPRDHKVERRLAASVLRLSQLLSLSDRDCLQRSLLLYRLLSRAGANPILVIGFRRMHVGSSVTRGSC